MLALVSHVFIQIQNGDNDSKKISGLEQVPVLQPGKISKD